jgi:hypothetical protein
MRRRTGSTCPKTLQVEERFPTYLMASKIWPENQYRSVITMMPMSHMGLVGFRRAGGEGALARSKTGLGVAGRRSISSIDAAAMISRDPIKRIWMGMPPRNVTSAG